MNKATCFGNREGTIEVKIRDTNYTVVYQNEVGLRDKKKILQLIKELQVKGADFISPIRKNRWW